MDSLGSVRVARRNTRIWFDLSTVLVALTCYTVAWPTLHLTHAVPAGVQPFLAATAALPVLLVRINPALGWAVSAGAALLIALAIPHQPHNEMPFQVVHVLTLLALLFAVALRSPGQIVAVAWAATALLFATTMPGQGESFPNAAWAWPIGLAALVLFGLLIRWLTLSRRQLVRQEEENELERARRAILEEKARIARDLHDVVAHHMSLVVVQAQTAPYRVAGVSPAARAEFESIGATAREALNEIRGMLGVLRSDGQLPEQAPQPKAADLIGLFEGALRAGVRLKWTITGRLDSIPETVGLALYRIAQESLSNASRHAPGAPVRVRLVCGENVLLSVVSGVPDGATVTPGAVPGGSDIATGAPEVVTGLASGASGPAGFAGARGARRPGIGGGHGIAGMRARAAAVGGELSAGARSDGGFEVRAELPLGVRAVATTAVAVAE